MAATHVRESDLVQNAVRASALFSPLTIREVTARNRIMVSPMCQYSSVDGMANDWHVVHLGARAVGGAGIVVAEATAVEERGRISPADLGIWCDGHVAPLARVADVVARSGAVPGIQLAHAGRKASTKLPWLPGARPLAAADGGWEPVVAPSPIPFGEGFPVPHELTTAEIAAIVDAWAVAARRARMAGFKVIEIHAGHGYLLHEFFSPVANQRTDAYGGSFERRVRIGVEVVDAIRSEWPPELPLFMRLSCTDWIDDRPSWTLPDAIALARLVGPRGVDLVDCSSGSMLRSAARPESPGYQVPFAEAVRREAGVMTAAVGVITHAAQAEEIVASGRADLVALARAMLVDPYWPLHAARTLGVEVPWPDQYLRARDTVVG